VHFVWQVGVGTFVYSCLESLLSLLSWYSCFKMASGAGKRKQQAEVSDYDSEGPVLPGSLTNTPIAGVLGLR
jgi:hypothetical protein